MAKWSQWPGRQGNTQVKSEWRNAWEPATQIGSLNSTGETFWHALDQKKRDGAEGCLERTLLFLQNVGAQLEVAPRREEIIPAAEGWIARVCDRGGP